MDFPAADDSLIEASGTLLGEAFTLSASGGTFLENIIQKRWPVKLRASGGGAELNLQAKVDGEKGHSQVSFDFGGEKIGGLANWIGTSPQADAAYRISGEATLDETGVLTRLAELQLGATSAGGELGLRREADKRIRSPN